MNQSDPKYQYVCPECGAEHKLGGKCWLCGMQLAPASEYVVPPPKFTYANEVPASFVYAKYAALVMILLIGVTLLVTAGFFGLLYWALVIPALLSFRVLAQREPGEASPGGQEADVFLTLLVVLGSIALLFGGAFVALYLICTFGV